LTDRHTVQWDIDIELLRRILRTDLFLEVRRCDLVTRLGPTSRRTCADVVRAIVAEILEPRYRLSLSRLRAAAQSFMIIVRSDRDAVVWTLLEMIRSFEFCLHVAEFTTIHLKEFHLRIAEA